MKETSWDLDWTQKRPHQLPILAVCFPKNLIAVETVKMQSIQSIMKKRWAIYAESSASWMLSFCWL